MVAYLRSRRRPQGWPSLYTKRALVLEIRSVLERVCDGTYSDRCVLGRSTRLVSNACGMLYRRLRIERGHTESGRCDKCKGLLAYMNRNPRAIRYFRNGTSGRCSNTGVLYSRRVSSALFTSSTGTERMWVRPSSSHALISVRRAVSPSPNNVVTVDSGRGAAWGSGRSSTERARAVRVKPCSFTRGTASFKSCALQCKCESGYKFGRAETDLSWDIGGNS